MEICSLKMYLPFFAVTLSCGGSSSANSTYLVQTTATSVTSPCTYTICKAGNNICRIRLDFKGFVIAGPQAGETKATGDTTNGKRFRQHLGGPHFRANKGVHQNLATPP